jgi:hypothetical protein
MMLMFYFAVASLAHKFCETVLFAAAFNHPFTGSAAYGITPHAIAQYQVH